MHTSGACLKTHLLHPRAAVLLPLLDVKLLMTALYSSVHPMAFICRVQITEVGASLSIHGSPGRRVTLVT